MGGPKWHFQKRLRRNVAAQVGFTKVEMRDGMSQGASPTLEIADGWTQGRVPAVEMADGWTQGTLTTLEMADGWTQVGLPRRKAEMEGTEVLAKKSPQSEAASLCRALRALSCRWKNSTTL
jgi:hypothetical protein